MLPKMTLAGLLVLCLAALPARAELPADIRERGVLRVVTLNQPTTWYLGTHGPEGLEYELASAFAASRKLRLEMWPAADAAALRDTLKAGLADIAAAQLTASSGTDSGTLACSPYDEVMQQWVYRRGEPRPRTLADVTAARVIVADGAAPVRAFDARTGVESWPRATATRSCPSPWGDATAAAPRCWQALPPAPGWWWATHTS